MEQELAEFYSEKPLFSDKNRYDFKNATKKKRLQEKATSVNLTDVISVLVQFKFKHISIFYFPFHCCNENCIVLKLPFSILLLQLLLRFFKLWIKLWHFFFQNYGTGHSGLDKVLKRGHGYTTLDSQTEMGDDQSRFHRKAHCQPANQLPAWPGAKPKPQIANPSFMPPPPSLYMSCRRIKVGKRDVDAALMDFLQKSQATTTPGNVSWPSGRTTL